MRDVAEVVTGGPVSQNAHKNGPGITDFSHTNEQHRALYQTHRDSIHPYSRPFKRRVGQGAPFKWGQVHTHVQELGWLETPAHLSPQFSRRDPAGTSLYSPLPMGAPSPLVRPAQPGREIFSLAAEARGGCGWKDPSSGSKPY